MKIVNKFFLENVSVNYLLSFKFTARFILLFLFSLFMKTVKIVRKSDFNKNIFFNLLLFCSFKKKTKVIDNTLWTIPCLLARVLLEDFLRPHWLKEN